MKKYLLIFLAVILAMSALTTTAFAAEGDYVAVSHAVGDPGEEVSLKVSVLGYEDVTSMLLTYSLPEGLTFVKGEWVTEGNIKDVAETNAVWGADSNKLIHGDVFTLTVKIEDAADDDVELEVEFHLYAKKNNTEVFDEAVNGIIVSHVTHDNKKTVTVPTCTEDGYTTYTCEICGESYVDEDSIVKAPGHKYGDWAPHKEKGPTCTEAGIEARYCTCGASEERPAEALDHSFTTYVSDGNATCTKDGTKTAKCDNKGCEKTDTVADKGSMKAHADKTKDHKCDTCSKELTRCADNNKDHKCDLCSKEVSKCADENKDHKCDVCTKEVSKCVDENTDYKCDICGKELEKPASTVEGVTRLAGADRLVTSYLVADQLKAKMGVEKFQNIIVASGGTFADALPGSYLSAVKNAPILLTLAKDKYVNQTADYIKANLASGGTVYILGGESAVPKSMEKALAGLNVQRVAGKDRFGTNLEILKVAGVKAGDEILVCTAKEFADSLSASATGKPILLVYKKITDEQKAYLSTLSGNSFCVVGGTTAVPDTIAKAMESYGNVTRLAGKDRLETSTMVAEKYFKTAKAAVVAYGWNFPDGLCGGSLAYAMDAPLILTHSKTKLAQFTADYTTKAGIKDGFVLGGDGLVDDAATRAIFGMGSGDNINILK